MTSSLLSIGSFRSDDLRKEVHECGCWWLDHSLTEEQTHTSLKSVVHLPQPAMFARATAKLVWPLAGTLIRICQYPLLVMQALNSTTDADTRQHAIKCHNCLNTCMLMKPPAHLQQTFRCIDPVALGPIHSMVCSAYLRTGTADLEA